LQTVCLLSLCPELGSFLLPGPFLRKLPLLELILEALHLCFSTCQLIAQAQDLIITGMILLTPTRDAQSQLGTELLRFLLYRLHAFTQFFILAMKYMELLIVWLQRMCTLQFGNGVLCLRQLGLQAPNHRSQDVLFTSLIQR